MISKFGSILGDDTPSEAFDLEEFGSSTDTNEEDIGLNIAEDVDCGIIIMEDVCDIVGDEDF
jgi:hypothetical protein